MNSAEYAERTTDRLEKISENWSLFSILTGAVTAGCLSVAALMLAVLLDMAVQFDAWSRGLVVGAWCLIALGSLLFLVVRPVRRSRTIEGTARRLEELFPQLSSDLINTVQLARERHVSSKLLYAEAIRQAGRHSEKVPLESAANQLTLRRRFLLCMHTPRDLMLVLGICLMIAVVGGVGHSLFPAWPNSVYRLFHPGGFVPAVGSVSIVEVNPGDTELLSGKSLSLTAKIDNPKGKPHDGELVTINDDGTERRYPLVPSESFDTYSYSFPTVTDPFRYRVEIGRTQSEHYSVSVFDRPEIRSMSAIYRSPPYMGQGEQTVELKGGAIEAPQFTNVVLKINTTAPVKTAKIRIGEQDITALARSSIAEVRAEFRIVENGSYTVHLTDEHGNENPEHPPFPIRVIPDEAPVVDIIKPAPEIVAAAGETIALEIQARDDFGLSLIELHSRMEGDALEKGRIVHSWNNFQDPKKARASYNWTLPESLTSGAVILYRASAHDNRRISVGAQQFDHQESVTAYRRIRIMDRHAHYGQRLATLEKFRQDLWRIFKRQTELRGQASPLTIAESLGSSQRNAAKKIHSGQQEVQTMTGRLSAGIDDAQQALLPFKSVLSNLAEGRMSEAVLLSQACSDAAAADRFRESASSLVNVQDDILDVLRKLLDLARAETGKTVAQMEHRPGGDLPDDVVGQLKDLSDGLKKFLEEQRKVIESSEELAKKPVEDFTEEDEQLLQEMAASEDEWSKFMNEKYSDLSRLPEQDFSNPTMLEELIEIETEIKMAADALTKKSVEIAVPLEQLGAEMAEEMTTNIEKWLPDTPDREKWSQEEPLTDAMKEAPMAELPNELEDLVGDLMEEEEDLFDEMEDVSSSWADSIDKGAGWDAMDGPISNMSARGVTGNRLPNTSEIGGRSGEGRSGKSSGEFVGETAVGKGGRKTPSRLTPDPFEKGQVKDSSKDPVGGATGGGKESGQGGEGLEGPIPPPLKRDLARLAGNQATLRNRAETIRMQFKIVNYNTAELDQLIELMKTVEQHLRSGHFRSALRRREIVLEKAGDLRNQATDETSIRTDQSASIPKEIRKQILNGSEQPSPAGWEELNKSYFQKIAEGK